MLFIVFVYELPTPSVKSNAPRQGATGVLGSQASYHEAVMNRKDMSDHQRHGRPAYIFIGIAGSGGQTRPTSERERVESFFDIDAMIVFCKFSVPSGGPTGERRSCDPDRDRTFFLQLPPERSELPTVGEIS